MLGGGQSSKVVLRILKKKKVKIVVGMCDVGK